ncbi:MAG: DUF1501 domain-containing protein [Chthoniobacterales bacterium]
MRPQDYPSLRTTRRGFIRQALCAAVGTAALSNTIRDLRFINSAMAQSASTITDYKALICVFLNGGNDSNNLFIPTIPSEYANYASIRTPSLAIPNTDGSGATALPLNNLTNDGHTYGIHPACPDLQRLFNSGKLASIFNVGTLVYPVTKAQYKAKSVALPPQLFSHADQQVQWQTSIPDRAPTTGWGGRCADLLDTYNPKNGANSVLSMCVSLAGANTFEVGGTVQQYSVSSSGVVSLNSALGPASAQAARTSTLNALLGIDKVQQNMLTENYALALEHALASGTGLTTSLNNTQLASAWSSFPTTVTVPNGGATFASSLMSQLKMVAKIIEAGQRSAAAGGLGMKRQVFFVQVGGYDLHTGQTNNSGSSTVNNAKVIIGAQANLFAELSQGLNAFQNAMIQIGAQYGDADFEKRVTAFTASDFGRTLPSNSLGSDHGWGSHHLVLGGAVRGQRSYGKFPALVVGGPDDTSTGRWIPTTSVDQFAATMARWFGVDDTHMSTVFPNLDRFSAPDLGFMG